jgi:4-amino-4-deoxychorismate lyase
MLQAHNSLPLLLETIKIEHAQVHNLSYHQTRCDKSRQILFASTNELDLSAIITPPAHGLYRCRILYAEKLHSIEYIPYTQKEIASLRIISSDIDYGIKYADRTSLDALLASNKDVDEVIIEKEGYLADTTMANIALYDGHHWLTPEVPLLNGTMRTKLIKEGFLRTKNIKKEDLHHYSQVALMNAMIGFKILNHFNIHHK